MRPMIGIGPAFALALFATGCSTPGEGPVAWHDATGSARGGAEVQADDAVCEQLRKDTLAQGQGMFRNPHTAYFECMRARGWQAVREPAASAADFCVTPAAKIGDRFTSDDGRIVRVDRVIGVSTRCSGKYPVLAQVRFD